MALALHWAELEASRQCSQTRGCKSPGMQPDELRVLPFTLWQRRARKCGDNMSRCFGALGSSHGDRSNPVPLQPPVGWPWGPAGPKHDLQTPSLELGPLQWQSSCPLPGCQNYLKQVPYVCGFLEFEDLEEVWVGAGAPWHKGPKLSLLRGWELAQGAGTQLLPQLLLVCE